MKLRSGKVVNHTSIRHGITTRLNAYTHISSDNYPDRLKLVHEIFMIIHENMDIIMKPDFSPNKKLLSIIYTKTFSLENESYSSLDKYVSKIYQQYGKKSDSTIRDITRQTYDFCTILLNVRAGLHKKNKHTYKPLEKIIE
jgi:hypothetical protein